MPDLIQFCNNFSPLSNEATEDLLENISTKTYKKGSYILREAQVCRQVYFINEGLVKLFFFSNKKEFVMRFFSENIMFSVFESYITQTPSRIILVALEDTAITSISYKNMESLCTRHHTMETLFRKLLSIATIKMTRRIREMLEKDAATRYRELINEQGDIINRISIGDVAKYLGITQQSLSRIRASK